MEKIINPHIKSFVQAIGKKEILLSEIAKQMGLTSINKDRQTKSKTHKKLKDAFLIKSEKKGRDYLVSLTNIGIYYLNLFNRLDQR